MQIAKVRGMIGSILFVCCSVPTVVIAEYSDQIYGQGAGNVDTVNTEQMNQELDQMQQDGQEQGGPLQEYMDQTNDTLQVEQPDQREIINDDNAVRNIDQQRAIQDSQDGITQHPAETNPNVGNAIKNSPSEFRGGGGGGRR